MNPVLDHAIKDKVLKKHNVVAFVREMNFFATS